jgi:hypothetical protein
VKQKQPKPQKASNDNVAAASKSEEPVLAALSSIGRPATEAEWREAFDTHKDEGLSGSAHRKRFSVGKPNLAKKGLVTQDENGLWSLSVTALPDALP